MLNNTKTFKTYDKADIAYGIERLAKQVDIAFEATEWFSFPSSYKSCDTIVVAGMGGSALGAHVVQTSCAKKLKKPMVFVHDYQLPAWVGSKTLVILSSFSGTTEEVLSAAKQAQKQKAKIAVITTGGQLLVLAKRNKWPMYMFEPGDLAKQPRLGLGFMICGLLGMLETAGYIKLAKTEKQAMVSAMSEVVDSCALDVDSKENPAKQVALALKDRPMLFVGSEHLVGCAHVITNQINETAKQFAEFHELPELNHHLMEGLTFPKGMFAKFSVVMIKSNLYNEQTKKRYPITAEVFEKQGAQVIEYETRGKTELEEVGELLQFGSFLSYYLGMINKVNPAEIPYVDWFKEMIKK
ncbi:MAG: Bifunctional phosphoglucose/phosphomannose isomerase [Candidatus Uhrbacteria bacterium GW2011_GWD2_41_121]|uniref:Bifunctional phosphoglucose/phosphomannose isomerase n=1 Tax=Candidatus Uhrbacteria bacterium GW2011_GWC1_41_20 TaxID=1618983 RepID=A0A0G0YGL4_9BACT|nr:MAG: Bifunctional phosphoglucose/phosphomannose isomerase [Candidatus Uhrbacteria bacterium GW2011_GWE1_39_46]KKR64145.1 MAG: Bifunctional phosphoglucose/phosphomannose isomerase [Candidatus Uhrbacteria bacterium GW2011_GWC2_40_450]KKR90280.1 MAG: Bifunctional phosphoglucose/phosphomannose isomerase [Candidatus Uhrbacteria bacterium GW2011_GWD2_41_121]KKR95207.1 MAG: Bifunctional phosphoglucose/phosphomannose isomerase [Candidatus Uhrbacteria bacterium GW2011_GWD1_41_16]KKR99502.1 MAG: Bifun